MTLSEIDAVIRLMKKRGVIRLEHGDLKLELSPGAASPAHKGGEAHSDKIETPDAYTPEQVLFWSSPGSGMGLEPDPDKSAA